jgi:hypothetical protein
MIINIHDDEIDITKFIIEKELMKSNEKQTCAIFRIILYCMEHYSESTEARVGNLLNSHERVIKIDKMLESNPTEQELIKKLDKNFPQE